MFPEPQARDRPRQAQRRLIVLAVISLLLYGVVTWLSWAFVYGQGHRQRPIVSFIGLYAAVFVLYSLALRTVPRLSPQRVSVGLILGFALLFRVALLFSNPIQEDDFYRYLWDGKMVASGLNPYRVAPLAVLDFSGAPEAQAQDGAMADLQLRARIAAEDTHLALILSRVNHPHIPTIYPPLAQGVFGLAALVAPGSLLALRLLFLGFDLAICGLMLVVLSHLGIKPAWVAVYAWSPLVIKESINSAHYDVVPTFFLVLALLLSLKEQSVWAQASLALAILGKVYPLCLVPVLLWRTWTVQGRRRALLGLAVMAGVIVLGYAPFWAARWFLWQGTLTFAEQWQTNSFAFPLLHALVGERWLTNLVVAALLGGTVLVLLNRYDMRQEQEFLWVSFLTLGALFLLSPVANPWYFLWLVPFLCLSPLRSWLLLSGLLGLYYLSFYFAYRGAAEAFRWVMGLEYVPFYLCWLAEWLKTRTQRWHAWRH